MSKGVLLVVCGPSGVGKGTVCRRLAAVEREIYISVSVTTRKPRPREKNGVHYFFVSTDEFKEMIAGNRFLEWAEVHGNYYGTPAEPIFAALQQGKDVLLEIDVQGALQVKENFADAVLVFILPPSMEELESRIRKRNTESEAEIQLRLKTARQEISKLSLFDYAIINEDVVDCTRKLQMILEVERLRTKRLDIGGDILDVD